MELCASCSVKGCRPLTQSNIETTGSFVSKNLQEATPSKRIKRCNTTATERVEPEQNITEETLSCSYSKIGIKPERNIARTSDLRLKITSNMSTRNRDMTLKYHYVQHITIYNLLFDSYLGLKHLNVFYKYLFILLIFCSSFKISV